MKLGLLPQTTGRFAGSEGRSGILGAWTGKLCVNQGVDPWTRGFRPPLTRQARFSGRASPPPSARRAESHTAALRSRIQVFKFQGTDLAGRRPEAAAVEVPGGPALRTAARQSCVWK